MSWSTKCTRQHTKGTKGASLFSIFVRTWPPLSGDPLFGGIREKSEWNRGLSASVPFIGGRGLFVYGKKFWKNFFWKGNVMIFPCFRSRVFYLYFIPFPFLFSSAHAAGAHPFSAVRERMQRERKRGESCFPPFEPPYKAAAAGLLRQPGKYAAALSGSARSNRRHTARVPPAQVCSYQDRKKQVIVFIRERPKDFSKNPYTKQTVWKMIKNVIIRDR